MKNPVSDPRIRQFLSYVVVGGTAALVEWAVFSLLQYTTDIPYLPATMIAFVLSTLTNWYLGKKLTFRNSRYQKKQGLELALVFLVSAVGLGFNMLLMILFVDGFGLKTNFLKTLSKIAATGIVFVWNFLSRKYLIYKDYTAHGGEK